MTSNAVPSNRLKLVWNSLEDPKSKEIETRMGMSVAQFMTALGYSHLHNPSSEISKDFVWPKHTDLEVRNPCESVYQYEPSDNSWSLRFRALGCYNVVPRPLSEPTAKTRIKTPDDPVISNSEINVNLKPNTDSRPGERDRLSSLLRSRSSGKSDLEQPSETITQAARHKLLEDLRLTDSEDDEPTSTPTTKVETLENSNVHSTAVTRVHPIQEGEREESHSSLPVAPNGSSLNISIDSVISRSLDPPPPFVSPISTVGGDGLSDRHYQTPLLHNVQSSNMKNSFVLDSIHADNTKTIDNRITVRKSIGYESSSIRNSNIDTLISNGPISQKPLPPSYQLHSSVHSDPRSKDDLLQEELLSCTDSSHPIAPHSNVTQASCVTNSQQISTQVKEPTSSTVEVSSKNGDYVRRILTESENVLAAEQSLLVPELSPRSSDSWKYQSNYVPTDKENLVTDVAQNTVTITSNSPVLGSNKGDGMSKHLSAGNNTKISFSENRSDSEPPPVTNDLTDAPTSRAFNVTSEARTESETQQTVVSRNLHSASGSSHEVDSTVSDEKNKSPSFLTKSGLSTNSQDETQSSTSPPSSKCRMKTTEQRKRSQKPAFPRTEFKLSSKSSKNADIDRKRSKKNCIISEDAPQIGQGSIPLPESRTNERPLDRASMPPPASEGTAGKRQKFINRFSEPDKKVIDSTGIGTEAGQNSVVPTEHLQTDGEYVCNPTDCSRESYQYFDHSKNPVVSKVVHTPSISRDIPQKQWVFANVALKKVRSKLQSVVDFSLPLPKDHDPSCNDLLDSIREALLSISSSRQRSNGTEVDCNDRPRTLTGVLLVPSEAEITESEHVIIQSPIKSLPPTGQDTATMTSPVSQNILVETLDAAVQCTLATTLRTDVEPGNTDVIHPSSNYCQTQVQQLPVKSISVSDARAVIDKMTERLSDEERSLRSSSVEFQLTSADECNANALRCWRSLVGAVSAFQSDPQKPGGSRSHLLLTLDALHLYPVYLMQGVRHYLAAISLLHSRGDVTRAADLCVEAAAQLKRIGRRLERVEAKLIKHRSRHQTAPISSKGTDSVAKAKQDAGWIHFWYYVLTRISSIIHSHEYRLRLLLDPSLLDEPENDCGFGLQSDLSTASSLNGGTSESKLGAGISSNARPAIFSSPSSKLSPTPSIESKTGRSAQSSNGPLETQPLSPSVPIRPSKNDRIHRLRKLTKLMHQAYQEWNESEKLALNVPRLPLNDPTQGTPSEYPTSSSDLMSGPTVDFIISYAAGGIYPNGHFTNIVMLLCFIDGVIKVHKALLEHLKILRATDAKNDCTVLQKDWPSRVNVEVFSPGNVLHHSGTELLEKPTEKMVSDRKEKESSRTLYGSDLNPCDPTPTKLSSGNMILSSPHVEHVEVVSIARPKASEAVVLDKDNKRMKRKRLFETDDPKLWDGNVSTANPCSGVEEYSSSSMSLPVPKKLTKSLEKLSNDFTTTQPLNEISGKPSQQRKLSGAEFRSSCRTGNPMTRSVVSNVADPVSSGQGSTPHELDSRMDNASPNYAASTPSPPPIRRRSKSVAPTCLAQRPGNQGPIDAECSSKLTRGKRQTHANDDPCFKLEEQTTYQPKRVRPTGSENARQYGRTRLKLQSPNSSPFLSYQPSDPDEVDKARLRRCASVGRNLSRHSTEAETKESSSLAVPYICHQSQSNRALKEHSEISQTNGDFPVHRSNATYSHNRNLHPSSKIHAAGGGDIPMSYEEWSQSSNKGSSKKSRALPKRY